MFNTKEERDKELNILVQSKGQLEASVTKVEKHLNMEDFKDYCDALYTCVAYNQKIQKRIKNTIIVKSDNSNTSFEDDDDKPF